jgi:hypothetical protein
MGYSNPGDIGTAVGSGGTATVNHGAFQITTEALSTASGGDASYTIINNNLNAASVLLIGVGNGSNTTVPVYAHNVVCSGGSATLKLRNANTTTALNGSVVIGGFIAA